MNTLNNDRRVVCAAIRAEDGTLMIGIRHYSKDMVEQMDSRRDGLKFASRAGDDQGFVDQYGVYMTREEAFQVAEARGQIRRRNYWNDQRQLFSENLY